MKFEHIGWNIGKFINDDGCNCATLGKTLRVDGELLVNDSLSSLVYLNVWKCEILQKVFAFREICVKLSIIERSK